MKNLTCVCVALCFFAMSMIGTSQSAEKPVIANFIIDFNLPTTYTDSQLETAKSELNHIYREFNSRGINATLILTQDVTSSQARLLVSQLSVGGPFEYAMSGNHSDEKLSSNSYEKQKAILERSKTLAEACKICGVNEVIVKGFMPQSFDQNEDTYKVLDELGIGYDAGFKAGMVYSPGHENDFWPYKVENHNFFAVPISTYPLTGENAALDDRYFMEKGYSSTQWYDALVGKFEEVSAKDAPMVVFLKTSISGSGDYQKALSQFLDYALSRDARFVTTSDLVKMARTGVHEAPASLKVSTIENIMNTSQEVPSGCAACNEAKNSTINIAEQNATPSIIVVNMTEK